jgi:hypothetical protein
MEAIKKRILEFAGSVEAELQFFTSNLFGSEDFFRMDEKVTVSQIIDLAAMYPELNMNWILTGKGRMLYDATDALVEALEEGIQEKQKEINTLRQQLDKVAH